MLFRSRGDYPINNLCLLNHSNKEIEHTAEHGNAAARRKPDIILARNSPRLRKGRAKWTDILTWCELKSSRKLGKLLASVRADRVVPPVGKASSTKSSSSAGSAAKVSSVRHCPSLNRSHVPLRRVTRKTRIVPTSSEHHRRLILMSRALMLLSQATLEEEPSGRGTQRKRRTTCWSTSGQT